MFTFLKAAAVASSGRQGVCAENRPGSMGKKETTNLSTSATFRKTREISAAGQVSCKSEKIYKLKKFCHEKRQEVWTRYIQITLWKASDINNTDSISHLKTLVKIGVGDCYLKCKQLKTRNSREMKNQGHATPPKDQHNPAAIPNDINLQFIQ